MFLTAQNLAGYPSISHGFFTRTGGVSEGIYASLNAGGRGTGDTIPHVDENRRRIAQALGAETASLLTLYQIHSTHVITVNGVWDIDERPQADAMVTATPGIALGILTADCVPLLFADTEAGVIGAAHAGWKGALGDIAAETVRIMIGLGAQLERIAVAIGPSIAKQSYEVRTAFKEPFLTANPASENYFAGTQNNGHWLFDLKGFIRDSLTRTGINNINMLENDTYLEESDFFSYRRATHNGEPNYGRQISAIMLKK